VNGDAQTKTENLTVTEITSYFQELKDKLFPSSKPSKMKKSTSEEPEVPQRYYY
jgi:hypothetical protein